MKNQENAKKGVTIRYWILIIDLISRELLVNSSPFCFHA